MAVPFLYGKNAKPLTMVGLDEGRNGFVKARVIGTLQTSVFRLFFGHLP